jgi:predicted DNA-binding transcriptional regulator YafY
VTAARLAGDLDVSVRTVYRDIQTLTDLGAPIGGEAGIGYLLQSGFFLPPLMFGEDELEALVLGARWVQGQGDPSLAQAAATALVKIGTASPKDLRDKIADTGLWAPQFRSASEQPTGLRTVREALRREHKLTITYVDKAGAATERVVWYQPSNRSTRTATDSRWLPPPRMMPRSGETSPKSRPQATAMWSIPTMVSLVGSSSSHPKGGV